MQNIPWKDLVEPIITSAAIVKDWSTEDVFTKIPFGLHFNFNLK